MLYLIAIINFIYAPLMFLLRNPPSRGETEVCNLIFRLEILFFSLYPLMLRLFSRSDTRR